MMVQGMGAPAAGDAYSRARILCEQMGEPSPRVQVPAGLYLRESLAEHRSMGHELGRLHRLALLAEAYGQAGQPEAGRATLAEALTLVAATEERWWEAEVYRLQAALLLQGPRPDVGQVEAALHRALEVARRQQARTLELRAALSLARLWRQQGKGAEAQALLAEVYDWFTEGFDTADLRQARALLDELR
jgi:predicted ATPase